MQGLEACQVELSWEHLQARAGWVRKLKLEIIIIMHFLGGVNQKIFIIYNQPNLIVSFLYF